MFSCWALKVLSYRRLTGTATLQGRGGKLERIMAKWSACFSAAYAYPGYQMTEQFTVVACGGRFFFLLDNNGKKTPTGIKTGIKIGI